MPKDLKKALHLGEGDPSETDCRLRRIQTKPTVDSDQAIISCGKCKCDCLKENGEKKGMKMKERKEISHSFDTGGYLIVILIEQLLWIAEFLEVGSPRWPGLGGGVHTEGCIGIQHLFHPSAKS